MSTHLRKLTPCILGACSTTAIADTVVQTADYRFDVQEINQRTDVELDRFDDMGGTRILEGVRIDVEAEYTLNMYAENGEDYAITAKDWFFEAAVFNNFTINDGDILVPSIGGVGFGFNSDDLAPNDFEDLGGDDFATYSWAGTISGFRELLPFQLDPFVGTGSLEAAIYPFLSLQIPPPEPFFNLGVFDHIHEGTITLTYEYSVVPTPGTAALLLPVALLAARRRRP